MANWLCSRESVKRALGINGIARDRFIDEAIESMSRSIERWCRGRIFIPQTQTRDYRWPPRQSSKGGTLWLDFDLLSVTTLKSEAQNTSPTTIAATDYFTEPTNEGPPYDRIEIDASSSAVFASGDTPQRSISVAGSWGYSNNTRSVGTVSSGLASSATDTEFVCSDGSVIDVGDTLLIESEQLFVSERDFAALGSVLVNDAGITASQADNTITLDTSHGVVAGEVIRLDSEQLYVEMVDTNLLTVIRAYNGTLLATHADNTAVHINRTLTVERAINGTTGATHADTTAMSKYEPEYNIVAWCRREVIAQLLQEKAGWAREINSGEAAREFQGVDIEKRRIMDIDHYQPLRMGAI